MASFFLMATQIRRFGGPILHKGGGGLDAKNKDGESPVIHAVKKGDVCMAEQLVSMQG
jgi:hypothetical protein